ncbi:hypothetical protein ACJJTC_011863 [Scirpophaga incertulas]
MPLYKSECDATVILGGLVVFALPLTLLIPDFSIWDVVPKIHVTRFHVLNESLTWPQSNAVLVGLLSLLFCFYLEIRKRKLDDIVDRVLKVSEMTDATLEGEAERQTDAMKMCVELLDTSTEHYEQLMLVQDDLRRRETPMCQLPPAIEPSGSNI